MSASAYARTRVANCARIRQGPAHHAQHTTANRHKRKNKQTNGICVYPTHAVALTRVHACTPKTVRINALSDKLEGDTKSMFLGNAKERCCVASCPQPNIRTLTAEREKKTNEGAYEFRPTIQKKNSRPRGGGTMTASPKIAYRNRGCARCVCGSCAVGWHGGGWRGERDFGNQRNVQQSIDYEL